MAKLYEQVSLNRDFPEYNLKTGDLATLIDTVPHPNGGEEGYVLEIFDSEGDSEVVIVPKSAIEPEKQVFISYSWREESNKLANQLEKSFQAKGITIIRDKKDLGYKGLIKEFMQQIGQGKCVILIISDAYLKSHNCMFELVEIAKNGDFYSRIFPIVLEDAKIYNDFDRLDYIQYWEQEAAKLQEKTKQLNLTDLSNIYETINLYAEIRRNIDQLTATIKNMNTLNLDIHHQTDFQQLIQAVENKLSFESVY